MKLGIALLLSSVAFLAQCKGQGTGPSNSVDAGVTSTQSLTPEQASRVLAKVGPRTITLGDYVATLEHMDRFSRMRYQAPERRVELLQEMIEVELLAQEAERRGLDKDPIVEEETRIVLREALLKEQRKDLPSPGNVAALDVRAYYDAHRAEFRDPERRRVSLLVQRDETVARAYLERALKASSPTEWGELVRQGSIDANARANVPVDLAGDFGFVTPPSFEGDRGANSRVPEAVRAAAFEIANVGDVLSRTVKADDGKIYVVKLVQRNPPQERTLEEAERSIRLKLTEERIRAAEEKFLRELRAQFPVEIDEAALARVAKELAADAGAAPPAAPSPPTPSKLPKGAGP